MQNLSFEYRILGGNAQDAVFDIRRSIDDPEKLHSLLLHEQAHMNRTTVIKALKIKLDQNRQYQWRTLMMNDNPILKFFEYDHLPSELQEVSQPMGELALTMNKQLGNSPEKSAGLRKLLEAKDCFFRARLCEDGETGDDSV